MGEEREENRNKATLRIICRLGNRLGLLGIAILVFLLTSPVVTLADPSPPDSDPSIIDVQIYRHILEDNDFLLVTLYEIDYTTPPDDPARDLFLFRLVDSGEAIGDALPYSYGMDGYQYGIISMYFSATDAPTWEDEYTLQIEGNPTQWTDPPLIIYTITSSDYSDASDQEEARSDLAAWMIPAIQDIEIDWNIPGEMITMTNVGTIFTSVGEYYILGAIPGFNVMVPDLFAIKSHEVDWDEQTWTGGRQDAVDTRYTDTPMDNLKNALSNLVGGVDAIFITSTMIIALIIVLLAFAASRWGAADPAYSFIPLVMLFGSEITFFPWALWGLTVFVACIYIIWVQVGKFSSG